jgi:hypothetical protein
MPILLRDKTSSWGDIALANNDILFEIIHTRQMLEVREYPNARAEAAAAREFSNRTEFRWDAFLYYVPRSMRNDADYIAVAKSDYHLHMFARLILGNGFLIEKLLPKSGHAKGDARLNLADEPTSRWAELVADMDSRTKIAVERTRIHYVERFLARVP